MALTITTPARTVVARQDKPQQRAQPLDDTDGRSSKESTAPARGTKPGVLGTALSMQDDLSALVSSLQRVRRGSESSTSTGVEAWIDHVLDESAHDKVNQLRAVLTISMTVQQVLRHVLMLFRDPSDAIAVLRALCADACMEELHDLLDSALALLDEELQASGQKQQAQAGLASAVSARRWSRSMQLDPRILRTLYREFICNDMDAAGQYVDLFDQVGFQRRKKVVDYLEQAVAADMYSMDPSCSVIEFGRLLHRIRSLANLRSMDQVILVNCNAGGVLSRIGLEPETLVRAVVDLVRGLCTVRRMMEEPLAAVRLTHDALDKGRLLGAVRQAVKDIPAALWVADAIRTVVIDDLEALVSESVRREWNAPSRAHRMHA